MKTQEIIFIVILQITGFLCSEYEDNIGFNVYKNNEFLLNSTFEYTEELLEKCLTNEPITIIVCGLSEDIQTPWALPLIEKLSLHRGGCIFWMEYSYYTKQNYLTLVSHFDGIQDILTRKLNQLSDLGYDTENGLMFGFSYGSHIAIQAAFVFGDKRFGRIDACDPAGPLFFPFSPSVKNAKKAAREVQCIHTSGEAGTILRYCQKSVNMGHCALFQSGQTLETSGGHGMCPKFYVNSFENEFQLVPKSTIQKKYLMLCITKQNTPDVTKLGRPVFMGQMMDFSIPDGEYFADSGKDEPYNVLYD